MTRFVLSLSVLLLVPSLSGVAAAQDLVPIVEAPASAPLAGSPPEQNAPAASAPNAFPERTRFILRAAGGGGMISGTGGDSWVSCSYGNCVTLHEIQLLEGFGRVDLTLGARLHQVSFLDINLVYRGNVAANDVSLFTQHTVELELEMLRLATLSLGGGVLVWNSLSNPDIPAVPMPAFSFAARVYFGKDSPGYFEFAMTLASGSDAYFKDTVTFWSPSALIGWEIF